MALVAFANYGYVVQGRHIGLPTLAVTVLAIIVNVVLDQKLLLSENLVITLPVAIFLAVFTSMGRSDWSAEYRDDGNPVCFPR